MSDTEDMILEAYEMAKYSPDPSTQNGAALKTSEYGLVYACNEPPTHLPFTADQIADRGNKLRICEHAERNVILDCARYGCATKDSTLYCPFVACTDCARAIIGAGVLKVVCHADLMVHVPERWQENIEHGLEMLKKAGVELEYFSGPIPSAPVIRFDGKLFDPKIPGFVEEQKVEDPEWNVVPDSMKAEFDTTNPKDLIGEKKPPMHLIPPVAEVMESIVMGLGAQKYGPFNWRDKKVKASVYVSAARRHLAQWIDGQDSDPESGVSHLAHVRACMGIILDAESNGNLIDDRPPCGQASSAILANTKS